MLFPKGSVFLNDLPLAHALLSTKRTAFCDGCLSDSDQLCACSQCGQAYYCSRFCQKSMWYAHKIECKHYVRCKRLPVAQIRLLIRLMFLKKDSDRKKVSQLISHMEDFKSDVSFTSSFCVALKTVSAFLGDPLPFTEVEIFQLYCQIQINSFMLTDYNGRDIAVGLYPRAARLDHSCSPNVEYVFKGRRIICVAISEIPNDTEARINYVDPVCSTARRRSLLKSRYFFECACPLCLDTARDSIITSISCCKPTPLEAPSAPRNSSSFVHRICPVCQQTYDSCLIQNISEFLSAFNDKDYTPENTMDAICVYLRLRNIEMPLKACVLDSQLELADRSCTASLSAHYQLFNHSNSVYLAQVSRCASVGILPEYTDTLLNMLGAEQAIELKDKVLDILLACSLDFLNWQLMFLPHPGYAVGVHASNMAGFLLRFISDEEFASTTRMEHIKSLAVSTVGEVNLAQLLCRLILLAEEILTPFSAFDEKIKLGLEKLHSHL